ncbi:MAG: hypothetical protein NW224_21445 [Leptolyngbyaceae cyanobacterium bins.302]|nr:hypothetical protein [Leptolyngbyaceae cyanobacterium bins.302]
MEHHRHSIINASGIKYMLAGGTVVAALGLLVEPQALMSKIAPTKDICQEVVQPKAVLSRDRLSQLLTIPERSNKAQIRQVMQEPYCQMPDIQARAGGTATREAYPLAFDPKTWLVVMYEGEEYVGYSFSFHR